MKKLVVYCLSIVLSVIMVYAFGITSFAADELQDELYPSFHINEIQQQLNEISITNDESFTDQGIKEDIIENEKTFSNNKASNNQAPIAGLKMVVLNPESMINGNYTTETQLAWLWSYNDQIFTYDPDGDSIDDIIIGGISNSDIIGTITGNIGFATQFKTAGQYQLTFQVQDSNGAWSNIVKYVFSIEPSDGNTRPICKIGYSNDTLIPNQLMMFTWSGSSDSDNGDKISGIGGLVIKDGVTTALGDYVVQLTDTNCVVSFEEVGSYEIWIRVSDTHNAWSNWVILPVEVENAAFNNVQIYGIYEPTSKSAWWVNDRRPRSESSIDASWEGANYLCETFGSHNFPDWLPDKIVSDNSFEVSGRLLTSSGTPVANTSVKITMPLTRSCGINQTVLTDSNGYFSYKPSNKQYWVDTGYYTSSSNLDYRSLGDISETETKYIRFSSSTGTNHLYPTNISVTAGGNSYTEDVTCLVGYTKLPTIGNLMYLQGEWYYL